MKANRVKIDKIQKFIKFAKLAFTNATTDQRVKVGCREDMPEGDVPCPTKAPLYRGLYRFGKETGFHKKYFSHFDFAAMNCSLFTAHSTVTEAGPPQATAQWGPTHYITQWVPGGCWIGSSRVPKWEHKMERGDDTFR